mmetsp:Transcript_43428/g.105933  ORF Transcript_43428/g.105933 Transcript_43428/m.105933 type:complete len:102 (-) Transcript_43428:364-669(-)
MNSLTGASLAGNGSAPPPSHHRLNMGVGMRGWLLWLPVILACSSSPAPPHSLSAAASRCTFLPPDTVPCPPKPSVGAGQRVGGGVERRWLRLRGGEREGLG